MLDNEKGNTKKTCTKITLTTFLVIAGQKSSGPNSPLIEEAVLSAIVPVISTACAALQTV